MKNAGRTFLLGLLAITLSACGGGGGDDGGGGSGGGGGGTSLSLDKTALTFATDLGFNTPAPQTVVATFVGDGVVVGTLPGASLPLWLHVSAAPTGSSPATVTVSISGPSMAPGRYSTTLRFASGRADGSNVVTRDVNVTYTVDHALTPATTQLAAYAGAPAVMTSADLVTAGATWVATTNQPWLTVSPASGTGGATLGINAASGVLAPGNYSGNVDVRDTVTNRTRSIAMNFTVMPRRLATEVRGVALSSTLGVSRLTYAVQTIDTAGAGGKWTAVDDAPWLSLGASSGTAGTPITLTANSTGLADGIYYATVTVSPDNEPGLTNSATVRVGFYVDQTTPPPPDVFTTADLPPGIGVAVDPIRPYAYVSGAPVGGGTADTTVSVINLNTGAVVASLPLPGTLPQKLEVSPDGSQLLVVDSAGDSLVPIQLQGSTRTVGTPWLGARLRPDGADIAFTQIGGLDVVLTSERQILSAATGAVLAEFEGLENFFTTTPCIVTAAPDGSVAFLMTRSAGNHRITRLALSNISGTPRAVATHLISERHDTGSLKVNRNSTRLVSLSLGGSSPPSESLRVYDTGTLTQLASRFPAGISSSMDLSATGDIYETDVNNDAFVQYGADLTVRGRRTFTLPVESAISSGRVSGDGLRAFVVVRRSGSPSQMSIFSSTLPP